MYKILRREDLSSNVVLMDVEAPMVAKKCLPGQFIILRVNEEGERIPLTIAHYDREKGVVTIIFQTVGATTMELAELKEGEYIHDFVGPLGNPSETEEFKGKKVAVIGGGDVAVEDAIFLARTCKKVYVIHRRDELRAAGVLQDALLALPNVEMVWDTVVDSIEGNEMVSGVKVTNKKAGEAGVITVDGVFIAVGIVPVSALIAGIVETDEAGYIKAGEDGVTSVPGVFAAGDVRTKQLRQIITAAADGANCVTSVEKYLISH